MSPTLFDTNLSDLEIAVFDLETTGLFPATDHIIQIGLVIVADGRLSGNEREWIVNPGDDVEIKQFILDLTGLAEEEIRRSPPIGQVLPEFGAAVGGRVVGGHNIKRFDLHFVRRAERRLGIDVQTDYYVDTLQLARKLKPDQENYKLATCARQYGLEFSEENLHDALADTRLCARLLLKQIRDLEARGVRTFGDMIGFLS